MIHISKLNRDELQTLIQSPEYQDLPFLPISAHRAISHIHNPRADRDDILLLLAYAEERLVGYLGVLADWIFDLQGQKSKCGWLSCMWIDASQRGKGISKQLVRSALEAWDEKILVTEFTYPAQRLYEKIGAFKDLQKIEGIRLYIRSDLSKLLPPKGPHYRTFTPMWRIMDDVLNGLLDWRLRFVRTKSSLRTVYVDRIDDEIATFIETRQEDQIFKRGGQELDWILSYPWIVEASAATSESKKYHFSSIAQRFAFAPVKCYNSDDKLVAFLMFALRDNALKVPYCYLHDDYLHEVKSCIEDHILKWRISTCTLFHPKLVKLIGQSSTLALTKKPMRRHYIISKVFKDFSADQDYQIQDGDADCAFT